MYAHIYTHIQFLSGQKDTNTQTYKDRHSLIDTHTRAHVDFTPKPKDCIKHF